MLKTASQRDCPVIVHTPEPSSSAALYVHALSSALTQVDVPVRVICPANHEARASMERNPMIDVRVCCKRGINPDDSFVSKIVQNARFIYSSCRALLKAAKPGDVTHFQYLLHLPFGLIFFLCARARGARIVLTVHDPVPHKFLFPKFLRGIELRGFRVAYRMSDVLVVHSEAGKQKLLEAFQVPARKIRVVLHGPYELAAKVRPCQAVDRLEVLFFGALRENKGLHLAIEAVQRLAKEGLPIRLTIAGRVVNRKERQYWDGCRKLIDPASDAIRLNENYIPDGELPELFSQCHCFVLPYTAFSSDSGVAYMALANAKPIVATDAGGLGWLLDNSNGGIRMPEASVEGVMTALREAAALGPAKLEQMGQAGADWVLSECGWPRVARETQSLYAEFIPQLSGSAARV